MELQQTATDLVTTQEALTEVTEALEAEERRYRVPQTGQRSCWDAPTLDPDEPHFAVSCSGTGQDGDERAGLAPPADRFVDNGDGTVTDGFTNLVWLKRADCGDGLSWGEAVGLAAQLNGLEGLSLCSLRDGSLPGSWRLPNVPELMSLVDFESPQSAIATLIDGLGPEHGGGGERLARWLGEHRKVIQDGLPGTMEHGAPSDVRLGAPTSRVQREPQKEGVAAAQVPDGVHVRRHELGRGSADRGLDLRAAQWLEHDLLRRGSAKQAREALRGGSRRVRNAAMGGQQQHPRVVHTTGEPLEQRQAGLVCFVNVIYPHEQRPRGGRPGEDVAHGLEEPEALGSGGHGVFGRRVRSRLEDPELERAAIRFGGDVQHRRIRSQEASKRLLEGPQGR